MRHYEIMIILDPSLDERTISPSLDTFLSVVKRAGGSVDKIDIWGRRRLAFEIDKHTEGIYAVIDLRSESAAVLELDRQLNLNESVLRTKVMRLESAPARAAAPPAPAAAVAPAAPAAATAPAAPARPAPAPAAR